MEIGPSVAFQSGSGPGPFPTTSKQFIWLAVALVAMIVAVYAPVRNYGFVGFDDPEYVRDNPHVLGGLTWESVKWAFSTGYFVNWHPLTWISHMLDVQLYGTNAGGHHITNVFFHIANTLLLFGLLNRMTGRLGRSAFVAGLFAVHPLHVESVAWVSERKDVLSTLLGLLALWAYLRYAQRPRFDRYLLVVLFFGMSLMAKPMLVTLPFVLLLLDVWPLSRITVEADSSGRPALPKDQKSKAVRLIVEKLPLLVLTIASSIVTMIVQEPGALIAFPVDFRVANAMVSYAGYIVKMLWPAGLAVVYPYPDELPGWQVFGSLLFLIVVSSLVISQWQRRPYLSVGWLWYLGTLVPVIGLVQVGDQAMADRYTYVPLIGLFIMVAWGIPDLLSRWPHGKIALPLTAGIVICACVVTARGQVQRWESDATLWSRALQVTTGNYVAHNNMGTTLAGQGRIDEALAYYAEALRLKPDNEDSHYNIGVALDQQGRSEEAMAHYAEALRFRPGHAEAHNNLGALLQQQGRIAEAMQHYREAVRLKPEYASAHHNLGNVLASQKKVTEALAHYTRALEIDPTNQAIRRALEELRGRP